MLSTAVEKELRKTPIYLQLHTYNLWLHHSNATKSIIYPIKKKKSLIALYWKEWFQNCAVIKVRPCLSTVLCRTNVLSITNTSTTCPAITPDAQTPRYKMRQLWRCESRMSGATRDHSRLSDHGPDRSRQPWWWWPATNTTDVAVPQLTTPASHQHHRRPRLATITTDDPG